MGPGKKPKTLNIYTVASIDDPNTYLTYAASAQEVHEYFDKGAKIHGADNFKIGCNGSEGENTASEQSGLRFISQDYILEELSKYCIYRLKLDANGVAALMRVVDMTLPLETSFIPQKEIQHYLKLVENLDSEVINKVRQQVEVVNFKDVVKVKEDQNGIK